MKHSRLYEEMPQGWAREKKIPGLPLWYCHDVDTGYWTVYSSFQWFRMSHNEHFPFSISAGKIVFMVEDF